MKIFKKIVLTFALVLAICLPTVLLSACGGEKKLSLVQKFKTEYYVGETLDVSAGILKYIDADGKATNFAVEEDMVSVFSTEKPGNRKLLITYKEETLTVDYTVKPWDVQNNVYYSDVENSDEPSLALYMCFNKDQNKVIMFNSETAPELTPEAQRKSFSMTKSFDEDGNIIYKIEVQVVQGDESSTSVTYTISNITKDSFKLSIPGFSRTMTIHTTL